MFPPVCVGRLVDVGVWIRLHDLPFGEQWVTVRLGMQPVNHVETKNVPIARYIEW